MEVHITETEGTMTARLVGRLDTPAAVEVTHEIQPLLDHAEKTLVLKQAFKVTPTRYYLDNEEMSRIVDTSDEWIMEKELF